jgi:hypothetical protein
MTAATSAKPRLAAVAKAFGPRWFRRPKYGILERLAESSPLVRLAASLCDSTAAHRARSRRVVEFASKLRRQDSNLNSQNQNLMCCRLHHDGPRISGEQVRSPVPGHNDRPRSLMPSSDCSATR